MQHKYVQSLRVVDADGNDKEDDSHVVVPVGGNVVFEAGANSVFTASQNEIEWKAGYGLKPPDAEMLAKWNAVVNGGSGTAHGTAYSFTGSPYYIARIKNTPSLDGSFFIGVDKCYHTGQFLDYTHPENTGIDNTLSILDTCPACIDCPEFFDIDKYLMKIKDGYDLQKDNLLDTTKILDKYISMVEMWNYIVNLKSWRYNAEAKGGEIYASCKYTNHTNAAIPAGIIMIIDFSNAPEDSRAFFIDTAVKTFSRTDCRIDRPTDKSIQLTTLASLPIGGGIRFYCGSLSPYYVGFETRVQVNFSIEFPTGGIGDKTTGFNTNIMVAIDPDEEVPPWEPSESSSSSVESSGP